MKIHNVEITIAHNHAPNQIAREVMAELTRMRRYRTGTYRTSGREAKEPAGWPETPPIDRSGEAPQTAEPPAERPANHRALAWALLIVGGLLLVAVALHH